VKTVIVLKLFHHFEHGWDIGSVSFDVLALYKLDYVLLLLQPKISHLQKCLDGVTFSLKHFNGLLGK